VEASKRPRGQGATTKAWQRPVEEEQRGNRGRGPLSTHQWKVEAALALPPEYQLIILDVGAGPCAALLSTNPVLKLLRNQPVLRLAGNTESFELPPQRGPVHSELFRNKRAIPVMTSQGFFYNQLLTFFIVNSAIHKLGLLDDI
jgi:hypothetical protein